MKNAKDRDRYIIRLFNPTGETVSGRVQGKFKNAKFVNLNEEYVADADLDNLCVKPYQIITIEVEKQ